MLFVCFGLQIYDKVLVCARGERSLRGEGAQSRQSSSFISANVLTVWSAHGHGVSSAF